MNFPAAVKRPITKFSSPPIRTHKPLKPHQSLIKIPPTLFKQSLNPKNHWQNGSFTFLSSSRTDFSLNSRINRLWASSEDGNYVVGEVKEPSFVEFITSERVKVVAMLALALALCNADRVVMSVAIVPLSLSNGWRQSFAGVVQVVSSLCMFI